MFYSVDDKIVEIGGAFLEKRLKMLTFETEGDQFPMGIPSLAEAAIRSSKPNTITINYGDGTVVTQKFLQDENTYVTGFSLKPNPRFLPLEAAVDTHTYTDGFTGRRFVTFEFQDIEAIISIVYDTIYIYGAFPKDVNLLKNLITISLNRVYFIETLDFNINKNLERLSLGSSTQNTLGSIPDSIFQSNLRDLIVPGVFDLSNNRASNFFKINQLSDTLRILNIGNSNNQFLPREIADLDLTSFYLGDPYLEMDELINTQYNLNTIYYSSTVVKTFTMMSFSNLNKLGTLLLNFDRIDISDLSIKWIGLKSLYRIVQFHLFIKDNLMFDEFIDQFYLLTTQNAYLTPSSAPVEEEYPNQFRNISWGHSSLTQTGAIQAPVGFVQGVSNGDLPMTQGEKIYVLKENYGHIITTAQP